MLTFSRENRQTNKTETVSVDMTMDEIAANFAATAGSDHWVWFWLAKHVKDLEGAGSRRDMIAFLADSFLYAIGMGLKRPMIRFQVESRRYKVYLSRRGTICFKSGRINPGTSDPVGDEEYVGCLHAGKFLVNKDRPILAEEQAALDGLAADPVGFLAARSKDMDRCSYCNLPLEDKRSKDVGYGATCAQRWGLPWGKSYDEKVPSFASIWSKASGDDQRNVRILCQAIRRNPSDETGWLVLGDALEEAGFPANRKPKAPERGVVIPTADQGNDNPLPKIAAKPQPASVVAPVTVPEGKKEEPKQTRAKIQTGGAMAFDAAAKRFTTEASNHRLDGFPQIIDLESPKTGRVIPFLRQELIRNNDNEITHAEYAAVEGGFSLVVLND